VSIKRNEGVAKFRVNKKLTETSYPLSSGVCATLAVPTLAVPPWQIADDLQVIQKHMPTLAVADDLRGHHRRPCSSFLLRLVVRLLAANRVLWGIDGREIRGETWRETETQQTFHDAAP